MTKEAAVESMKTPHEKPLNRLGIKTLGLIAYFICTAIGFSYATAYYDSFGINILNHVAPLDLLFISVAHLGEILTTPLIVLLEVVVIATILLLSYLIAVVFTAILTVSVYIYFTPMSLVARALGELTIFYWTHRRLLSRRAKAKIRQIGDVTAAYQRRRSLGRKG